MRPVCVWCGASIMTMRAGARFCGPTHRVAAHRAGKRQGLPHKMVTADRWVRRSAAKVPLTVHGTPASSTDPTTWSTFQEAEQAQAGVGLGFMLGDGFACIDLDHCLVDGRPVEAAARFLEAYRAHYIEVSPSGDGLHIWGTARESVGSRRIEDGVSIETYSQRRYITVTRQVFQAGHLLPL